MARVCGLCACFCVYLVICLRILSVLSNSDYNFYETDSMHDVWSLQLLENTHSYQKRDVSDTPCSDENFQILNSTQTSNATEEISVLSTKKKSVKPQKTLYPSDLTKLTLKDSLTKNLGVNGSGQRIISNESLELSLHNSSFFGKLNKTDGDESEIAILKFPNEVDVDTENQKFNKTLTCHNITKSKTDNHKFYISSFYNDPELGRYYWVNLDNRTGVKVNELLSNSHRRAATIKLSFEFPFYGHLIKNVTIATGGFLYTGDYVHSWLAATQYIAPLMANFDTSLSNDSFIRYIDNGTAFTVEWGKVNLREKPNEGEFTFQATLFKNGDVVFVYQSVPLIVEDIDDNNHPVKVGLSDAYILDRTVFFVRRKTIYEYHRVTFDKEDIRNWTVIYLKAQPTCLDSHDCFTCLTRELESQECIWCPTMNKCSSGFDRHRQEWTAQECDKKGIDNATICSEVSNSNNAYLDNYNNFEHLGDSSKASRIYTNLPPKNQQDNVGISGIVAILFLVAMVSGLAVWVFYAYRNPHTTSGQILIRYRPSQWRWRRGEARYTAATIHM